MRSEPEISESRIPHTCLFEGCMEKVCQHHTCGTDCEYECVAFICRTCKPITGEASNKADALLIHAKMYELADKYSITDLKDLVKEKFQLACQLWWDTPTFANAAHYVFSTTPDQDKGLRDIVASTITSHAKILLTRPDIEALLSEFNDLTLDLLKAQVFVPSDDDEGRRSASGGHGGWSSLCTIGSF